MNISMERQIEILKQIKTIPELPKIEKLNVAMAAEYFNAKLTSVATWCKRNINKLIEVGCEKLTIGDMKELGYDVSTNHASATCSFEDCKINMNAYKPSLFINNAGMCLLANSIRDSEVAEKFRAAVAFEANMAQHESGDNDSQIVAPNEIPFSEIENEVEDVNEEGNSIPEMSVFTNEVFGELRTYFIEGDPWFVASDVCKALEISNVGNALSRLDDDEKNSIRSTDVKRGNPNITIVNEPALYSLVLAARKPQAKAFKRWITHEVIPSIRKHGGYMVGQNEMTDVEMAAHSLIWAKSVMDERAKRIAQLETRNEELEKSNIILAGEARRWDYNSIVNRLVRSYARQCCGSRYGVAWDEFHRQLQYKYHINLKQRKPDDVDQGKTLISRLKDKEWPLAAQVALAMCKEVHIDTEKVINRVNEEELASIAD